MQSTAQTQDNAVQSTTQPLQGFIAEPRAYMSKDGQYLTLVLPGNMRVRKHRHWFMSILGLEFEAKSKAQPADDAQG